MNLERRKVLKVGGGVGLLALFASIGLVSPAMAEVDRKAFSAKSMDEALSAMGVIIPEKTDAIKLSVPEIAENGAVVPVSVETTLAKVEQISFFVDKNPNVLAAHFYLPAGTEGMITTRVKMGQTANVIALVKADGKFYKASREVKVTAGGCGG
ncbi:MAG: thiosulfate oxidation carrier protein SoxY [Proteobacteria bacterium]|nr:thiosulfate oxidation carrier protein SoxY [Pseudomonadota bacterium]